MSFRQELVTTLCDATRFIKAMATLMIFFGLLSAITLVIGEPGTGSYALAIINFVLAVLFVSVLTGLFWYCRQRPDAY
jgi:hypothetical protein